MRPRDSRFAAGALALTLVVPVLLVALQPFGEARATFGSLVGWGVALAVMVPSYVLLSRGFDDSSPHAFVRAFMLGALLRMLATVAAVTIFVLRVEQAPVGSFLLAYFLGYALLTGLELLLTVARTGAAGRPAPPVRQVSA